MLVEQSPAEKIKCSWDFGTEGINQDKKMLTFWGWGTLMEDVIHETLKYELI